MSKFKPGRVEKNSSPTTQQKMNSLFWPDETGLNNVLLPTLFKVVNNIVENCYT